MTSVKRSTLKLDLKCLTPQTTARPLGRIGLIIVTVIATISTIISISTPSSFNPDIQASSMVPLLSLESRPSKANSSASARILEKQLLTNTETVNTKNPDTYSQNTRVEFEKSTSSLHQIERPFNEVRRKEKEQLNYTPTASTEVLKHQSTTQPIEETDLQINSTSNSLEKQWHTVTVKSNDTLSQIFNRLGLSSREAYAIAALDAAAPLKRIRPGQKIEIAKLAPSTNNNSERFDHLRYTFNTFDTLTISKTDQGFEANTITQKPIIRHHRAYATINRSLLGAANSAKIPYDVVYQLATIFGWQVDFTSDIQRGDKFTVIYEEHYLDNKKVGSGRVVAAELTTGSKTLHAFRHIHKDNRVIYYGKDGGGIQGSFLRNPIKFARVTSKFSKSRLHPIKKVWRAHNGVDYGAPKGTPIRATGDGIVISAGSKGGYGRTVVLRHGEKYETLYAHMSRVKKGIRKGVRVQQGDIIGYVGRTGWATGNHLHYEFRVAGKHMNPLTVELPKSASLDKEYLRAFKQQSTLLLAQLKGTIPLAQAD